MECQIKGCFKPERGTCGLCEMHYGRIRRTGGVWLKTVAMRCYTSHGYVTVPSARDHPLHRKRKASRLYEHRSVFFDTHGYGPFLCNWCAVPVGWTDMHIDHVNGIKDDNRPENLVASCAVCNQERGRPKSIAITRANGRQLTHGGRTMCLSEWAREVGIVTQSLKWRIDVAGWPIERALAASRGTSGPRRGSKRAA